MLSGMTPRLPVVAGALALAGLLLATSSCGSGSSSSDPLATYRTQALSWRPCDPSIVPAAFSPFVTELGARARCALMRVPLDYENPSRGDAVVALLRVTAEGGAPRKGAILFNPGGPGDDGLFYAVAYGTLWTSANPLDAAGALFKEVSRTYDLVGFSPRGVGASTRAYCGSNELQPFVANFARDRSPENRQAMLDKARLIAESCRKSPLTPFVNSEATARDMDLVRHLLGDEKLNYWGYSYGTWLGAWYASRFPDRVGRMVLGGTMDVTGSLPDAYLGQALGMQRVLDQVIAPYAARHPDLFGLGSDVDAVRAIHPSLSIDLQAAASDLISDLVGAAFRADSAALALRAAQVLQPILDAHPTADEQEIAAIIEATTFVPSAALESTARGLAHSLRATYFANVRRDRAPVNLVGGAATQWMVSCNDAAMTRDAAAWMAENDRLAALYPFMGGFFSMMPCLYWGGPSVARPALDGARRAGGILMLQSELDPQTPLEGARVTLGALPNASMVQIDGENTHAVWIPYGVPCVDLAIGNYLVSGTQPVRETHCQGLPLSADRVPAVTAAAAGGVHGDPALARATMEAFGARSRTRE